jgi:hypothetical protein
VQLGAAATQGAEPAAGDGEHRDRRLLEAKLHVWRLDLASQSRCHDGGGQSAALASKPSQFDACVRSPTGVLAASVPSLMAKTHVVSCAEPSSSMHASFPSAI